MEEKKKIRKIKGEKVGEEQKYSSSTKTVFPRAKLNHTMGRLIGFTNSVLL